MQSPAQAFFDAVKPALLKHIQDGMSGIDLAFWIFDGFGAFKLQMLIAPGPARILEAIPQYDPALYAQLAPTWDQFGVFVHELCSWTAQTPRPGTEPEEEPGAPAAAPIVTPLTPPPPAPKVIKKRGQN